MSDRGGDGDPPRPPAAAIGAQQPQRWSPFPVQDWSRMPAPPDPDPWWAYVDPSWGPPQPAADPAASGPARPWWPPLIILAVIVALIGGGMWVADRGRATPATAASAYVPADGSVAYQSASIARPGKTVRQRTVTESARLVGPSAILSTDATFASLLFGALGTVPTGQQFWRTTTTEIASPTASQQLVAVYRVDAAVELVGESGFGVARTFRPGLVELPADVAAGSRWRSSGTSGTLRYDASSRAESEEEDCLRVTTVITLRTVGGQVGERRTTVKTWCRGDGVTAETERSGAVTTTLAPISRPAASAELRTSTEAYDWSDPTTWRPREIGALSIDPNFGEAAMAGTPGAAAPVVAASGLLIRPSSTDDLVAFTPKTTTEWTSVWRMHPGGRIMSLAAFGDVVVVTTSQRRVVAYSDAGVRLWSLDLDDVAFFAPVRTGNAEVALVDASGALRLIDLRSGRVSWQVAVGAEVDVAPAAGSGVVVVMDGSGTTSAFAVADGARRWSLDLEAARAVVLGDLVAVQTASTLTALSLSDGRYRWIEPTQGTVTDLQAFAGHLVLATKLGTTVWGADGSVLQRRTPYLALTVNGDRLIGWGAIQAEVLDRDGGVVATWDTPDASLRDAEVRVVADRYGVWRFTSTWTMLGWTDQP